jgi:HK97 family phage portal protein
LSQKLEYTRIMNLLDNIKNVLKPSNKVETVAVIKKAPPMSQRMDVMELPEPPDKKTNDYLNAMRGWVFIAVKSIAQEVAKIELVLYRKRGGKVEIVEQHEMLDVLNDVNPFTTRNDFFEATQAYMELCGESFWWKYKNGGKPKQLWILRPDFIDILPPKGENEYIGGYKYKVTGMKEANIYPVDDVVHFKMFNPTNPYRGLGALQAADYAYDTDLFASKWNRNFFYNNAMPTTILTTEQNIKAKDIDRIRREWENKFGGVSKAHKMAILTGGLKVDDVLKQSIKDMDFMNLRKFSRDEIFTIFQVPPTIVGITEDVNRANASEGKAVWLDNVIKPKMEKFVAFLNEFYTPEWGEEYYFGFKDPSPTSLKMNLELITRCGSILTVNEKRELIEYDPIDGGDDLIIYDPNQDTGADNNQEDKKMFRLKGKRPVKKEKIIVEHKTTTADKLRRKVLSLLKRKGVDKTLKKMLFTTMAIGTTKEVKKKEVKKEYKGLDKEQKESFWKAMVKRSESQEIKFAREIRKYWKGQEKRVIFKLKVGMPKSIDSYLYEMEAEDKILVNLITPLFKKIYAQAGEEALRVLGLTGFEFTEEVMEEINQNGLLLANSINSTTKDALRRQLMSGISNHESVNELAKRVSAVYADADKARAETIARTETIRANNEAHIDGYKQSGVVEMKEWMAALDERTCEFCLAMEQEYSQVGLDASFLNKGDELIGLDGGTLKIDYSNLEAPPIHPSCRCVILPVLSITGEAQLQEKLRINKLHEEQDKLQKEIDDAKKEKDDIKTYNAKYKQKKLKEIESKIKKKK